MYRGFIVAFFLPFFFCSGCIHVSRSRCRPNSYTTRSVWS